MNQRQIKFRAWYDFNKQLHFEILPNLSVEFLEDGTLTAVYYDEGTTYKMTLEQFTGLLDKNGKEIYEGDIVKCVPNGCAHIVEWREELGGKYGGGMPGWYLSDLKSGLGEGYAWMGEEEVVGNIHENPELVAGDK